MVETLKECSKVVLRRSQAFVGGRLHGVLEYAGQRLDSDDSLHQQLELVVCTSTLLGACAEQKCRRQLWRYGRQ